MWSAEWLSRFLASCTCSKSKSTTLFYFAEYRAGKLSYKPEWVVNDPIEFRFGKEDKAFLKRPDGKELEVVVVKKVRRQ